MYELISTPEFEDWKKEQPFKDQIQIDERLSKIENDGHFGTHKDVGDPIWELKWGNGRRVYYAYIPEYKILLLLGGNKNGQDKDIAQAKKIFRTHCAISVKRKHRT